MPGGSRVQCVRPSVLPRLILVAGLPCFVRLKTTTKPRGWGGFCCRGGR
ncbi:pyrBI operon leader peptide [Salmonella enterica]|nr:pyrBI operon leader peptide [Salmonella enterica]MCF3817167.1 pyrBI operon leader peptide [Salmonella enterica subsp. enterica serovar Weltevreden]